MPFDWSAEIDPMHAAQAMGGLLRTLGGDESNDITGVQKAVQTPEDAANPPPMPDLNTTGFLQPFTGSYPTTSGFGQRGEGFHAGMDIGMPTGTPLLAANGGVVTHAASDDPGGYGTWVEITSPNGISTRYGHMSELKVKPGQSVSPGALIGISGATGNARGAHLHFEVRKGGSAIDPAPYLSGATAPEGVTPAAVAPDAAAAPASAGTPITETPSQDPMEWSPNAPATAMPTAPQAKLIGMDDYFGKVLSSIGAPASPANLAFMRAWQKAEGGDTTNPFNTTQESEGATNFNSVGVKRYPTPQAGIKATVQTLTNGKYGGIIAALKAGTDPMAAARALAGSPWGTGGLVMQILGGK